MRQRSDINGETEPGRRRFTLAHEIGHHVFADEYSVDLTLAEVGSETERRINAFAIHLLLLRNSVVQQWRLWAGEPREKAIRLGVEYRVSWSALCGQLKEDLPQLDAVPVEALQREFDSLP